MAYINNYYICAENESVTNGVDVTSHPVESGIDVTDNAKVQAIELSINGIIVNVGKTKADTIIKAITSLNKNKKLVKFSGRYTLPVAVITDFQVDYSAEIAGGCKFSMSLKEIRIVKSAYKASAKTSTTTKQVTKKSTKKTRYYTVKSGDCLWNIAKKYYGNGAKYTKIYNANKKIIKNPDLIYPKQKLVIPY